MAELGVQYINPFLMAVKGVTEQVCQVGVSIGKPVLKGLNYDAGTQLIIIGITGDAKGQVIMAFPNDTVLEIASKMCMMPMTEMNEIVKSAIAELGNMTMGNAATYLSTGGVTVDITPPTVCSGAMRIGGMTNQIICIPMGFDNHTFEVNIALKVA